MNNFLLSEEITSAFPNLLGNCSWVLGQCILYTVKYIKIKNKNRPKTKWLYLVYYYLAKIL
jgi:hypothetical protein